MTSQRTTHLQLTLLVWTLFLRNSLAQINVNCPVPMCSTPCPDGEYLALNSDGCETCDCYNPCQDVNCSRGECSWILNEYGRPKTFCADCPGGQVWNKCGSGSCIKTCSNTSPVCPRNCYSGCYCPPDKPVWHHETCITVQQCQDQCDGDQVWTDRGSDVTPTCANPDTVSSDSAYVGRCACPSDKPLWDERTLKCVTLDQCQQIDTKDLRLNLDGM